MNYRFFFTLLAVVGFGIVENCAQNSIYSETRSDGRSILEGNQEHSINECAASGALRLGTDMFLVGSDEDNVLRLYSTNNMQRIRTSFPLAAVFQGIDAPTIKEKPKTDIEGAAWLDDIVFWIGSHSMNTEGTEEKPDRRRIFAHEIKYSQEGLTLVRFGHPYSNLIKDLSEDSQYKKFNLEAASKTGSKTANGLSIEGLATGKNSSLLIVPYGFNSSWLCHENRKKDFPIQFLAALPREKFNWLS